MSMIGKTPGNFECTALLGNTLQGRPHKINVVLNWFEELKEQLPVE